MAVSVSGGGSAGAGVLPPEYSSLVETMRAAQTQLASLIQQQTALEAQATENAMVKEELSAVKEGESIYKLMGKTLVKQDKTEVDMLVNGRLDMITKELNKVEGLIKGVQEKMNATRKRLYEIQQAMMREREGA